MATVMITGASAGLGASIARQFASRGDSLVLVARRKELLETLQADLMESGAKAVEYRVVDLAEAEQVQKLANELDKLGIDVLINNAALGHWDYSWETPINTMQSMIAVNVSAVAMLSLAFSKLHHSDGARLMNVASGAGYALFEGSMPYSASKFFVTALTEGIAEELRSQQKPMKAQLLAPGPIATEFMQNALEGSQMPDTPIDGIQFHTADEVATFAMQLYDSDSVVGAVQPDMSFALSGGVHPVGSLIDASW